MEINKIYQEPCLATMAAMPDNFVDVVITSPPYNKAGYEGFIRKAHAKDAWKGGRNIAYDSDALNDFMPEAEYEAEQIKVLNEICRILKPDGSLFYNHKVRVAQHKAKHPIEWLIKSNLTFRQQITWNRKSTPAVAPIRFLPTTELIFWMTKTPCQPNFERSKELAFAGEVWDIIPKPNPLHPAPFPEDLPANILKNIKNKKGVLVYDPYSGTGTTLVAAIKEGFNFIGSEICSEYIEVANRNINENSYLL